jgi:hypothetical protein
MERRTRFSLAQSQERGKTVLKPPRVVLAINRANAAAYNLAGVLV